MWRQSEGHLVEVFLREVVVKSWHPVMKLMPLFQPKRSIELELLTSVRLAMMCPCLDMRFSS
jgi:hypothetical protein